MFIKEPSNIQVCIKTCTAVSGSNVNILSITEPELGTYRMVDIMINA